MSYLRAGSILPSGKESNSYVFFDGEYLQNYAGFYKISGEELKKLLKEKSNSEIKKSIKEKLNLSTEEATVVVKRLLKERDKGEWQ